MTNSETITILKDYLGLRNDVKLAPKLDEAVSMAIDALQESEWIPFLFDENGEFDCRIPYEDDEIVVSSLDDVWKDTWICTCDGHGYYIQGLESGEELVGLAWKSFAETVERE